MNLISLAKASFFIIHLNNDWTSAHNVENEVDDSSMSSLRGHRGMLGRLFDAQGANEDEFIGMRSEEDYLNEQSNRYPKLVPAPVNVDVIEGEYIVVLETSVADVERKMQALVNAVNKLHSGGEQAEGFGSVWSINNSFKGQAVKMTPAQAEAMSNMRGVRYIERNVEMVPIKPSQSKDKIGGKWVSGASDGVEYEAAGTTNTPMYRWNLDRIDQEMPKLDREEYSPKYTGRGVLAVILDDGINGNHADFKSRVIRKDLIPLDQENFCEENEDEGQGTFLAGIVGGEDSGVAKEVSLVDLRRSSCKQVDEGKDTSLDFHIGIINHIAKIGANTDRRIVVLRTDQYEEDVVQNSLREAIVKMINSGIILVVGAGDGTKRANNRAECDSFPANMRETITVGATEFNAPKDTKAFDGLHDKTNLGCVDIFAPGVDIWSVDKTSPVFFTNDKINGDLDGGTASAAAHVTGAVAMILEEFPNHSPTRVKDLLQERATKNMVHDQGRVMAEDTPNLLLFIP